MPEMLVVVVTLIPSVGEMGAEFSLYQAAATGVGSEGFVH